MKNKNNKHIEKMIKNDFHNHTPDIIDSIDFKELVPQQSAKQSIFKRKLPYGLVATFTAIVIVLMVVMGPEAPIAPGNGNGVDPGTTLELSSKQEFYSVGAFSAVTLLDQTLDNNNVNAKTPMVKPLSNQDTALIEDYLSYVNGYINMAESIIMGRESLSFHFKTSPLDDYTYSVQLSGINLNGTTYTRTLHYNETEVDEGAYIIDGIMVINNVTYKVEGEVEIDDDDIEMSLIATHPDNEDTYLEIYQSIENDEQTYEYEFVRNGDTIFESSLEIEFEEEDIITEITHETLDVELELTITRLLHQQDNALTIEYEIDSKTQGDEEGIMILRVIYDETQSRFVYEYVITIEDGPATFTLYKPRQYQETE